mmetsp:Transcript_16524/g.14425  ORF Transcript_16524/g.14425 Transcript_16524/m.14425 type:complete len:254 (-) Transcript_16524:24-785(-)
MINKKIFFSLFTIPVAVLGHEASEYQRRRKEEKENEITRRTERLTSAPIDLTPQEGKFAFRGLTNEQIEEEYGFKRVKIKGLIDLENEVRIEGSYRGENGFFIVNPLYTHVNDKKEPCGIMVNRGFLSFDWKERRDHRQFKTEGEFEGVIYTGDNWSKYDFAPNTPTAGKWKKAVPSHLALNAHLKNREDADKAMLMLVEFDVDHQTIMPSAPTIGELTSWKNTPARHNTYELLWKYTTYLNLFANSMFWLYF